MSKIPKQFEKYCSLESAHVVSDTMKMVVWRPSWIGQCRFSNLNSFIWICTFVPNIKMILKNCSFESAHVLNVDRRTDERRLDIIHLTFVGRIKIKSANPVYLFHKDVCLFLWVEHHLTREHDKGHYVDRVCLLKDSLGRSTGCFLPFARSRGLVTD